MSNKLKLKFQIDTLLVGRKEALDKIVAGLPEGDKTDFLNFTHGKRYHVFIKIMNENDEHMAYVLLDENNKTVKVQGYKARLERTDAGNGKFNYKLDVPFLSSLLTLNVDNSAESEILGMANKIPFQDVAKLIQ